jgi:hypothetical protein
MLEEQQYQLTPAAEVALKTTSQTKERPLFANARSIKCFRQSSNASSKSNFDSRGQVLTKKELVNLEAEDILQSTIFND